MEHSTKDLRTFLAEVEQAHEVLHITKAADAQNEVPALCSETTETILFENLKGHDGWRLADGLVRDRRQQAIALGCEEADVIATYAKLSARGPGNTCVVKDAPVQEVVWTGDEVNLNKLPVPIPAEGTHVPHLELKPEDFFSPVISGSIGVTNDPDTKLQNCFFTMAKVHSEQRAHCYVFSPHTWANIEKYKAKGERTPLALVMGCHPIYELAAAYTGPHPGFSELQLAAGMLGETVAMVNCKTVDLQVPAYAEVVIEGYIDPEVGKYIHTSAHTDTHSPFVSMEPFFDVTAITMRKAPIYRHIQPTRFTDHHAICEFITAPMMLNILRGKGLDVIDVAIPMHSALNCAVIKMNPRVKEEVREALLTGMSMPFFPRLTIAVDDDVNIHDTNDIIYALSIRVDPAKDIMTVDGVRSFNLEPMSTTIPGLDGALLRSGGRYAIDATKPPLSQPEERIQFERLRAKGEGKVFLKDFL